MVLKHINLGWEVTVYDSRFTKNSRNQFLKSEISTILPNHVLDEYVIKSIEHARDTLNLCFDSTRRSIAIITCCRIEYRLINHTLTHSVLTWLLLCSQRGSRSLRRSWIHFHLCAHVHRGFNFYFLAENRINRVTAYSIIQFRFRLLRVFISIGIIIRRK